MGVTPDRTSGPSEEEELILDDRTSDGNPSVEGAIRRVSNDLVAFVGGSVKSLTEAASGITETQHRSLRQLIHFIDQGPTLGFTSGAYKEITGSNIFPSSCIWYDDNTKSKKIVEQTVTRNNQKQITSSTWKMYDVDGSTVLETVTDTVVYDTSGIFEQNRTRVIV